MSKTNLRIVSVITSLALLAGAAAATSFALLASAETGGPTVALSSTSASTTNASSIPVTATFSEDVTGFDAGDVTLGGTASSSISGFASSSNSVFTFNVLPGSDGTITVQVPAGMASSSASSTGNQASNTLTFTSDMTVPVISDVSVATTSTTATITWTTSEAATDNASYGTTTSYNASSTIEVSASTTHSATLTGLDSSTTYHFQISATDAAGNTATTSDATFTTAAALLAPAISGIAVSGISTSSATITWNTDLPATTQVVYGTTTSYGSSSAYDGTASTTHSVTLTSLAEGTLYHFAAKSGNVTATTTSSDQSFVTQSTASSTPLAVTGTDTVSSTATADNTYANGWKWVMHLTVPDDEDAFHIKFSDWVMNSSTSFATANNVRVYSAQSSNANSQGTAITETSNGYSGWLYLTGDASTTTPGRQIDLTIEVKIPVGTPSGSYTTTFTAQSFPSAATSTAPTI